VKCFVVVGVVVVVAVVGTIIGRKVCNTTIAQCHKIIFLTFLVKNYL
jgi:hypothetical protein